jgi:hypothetical protein
VLAARSPALFSGTHHNAGKLTSPGSQQVIHRRIRRYAVLADFIREHAAKRLPAGITVDTVRPIFFPGAPGEPPAPGETRDGARVRVAIIGSLHPDRRDYAGLARLLGATPLDARIELVVLGDASTPDGRAIRDMFLATPAAPRVTFAERFLDFPELFREVARCDAVLPLIHPGTPRFEEYRTVKITGASLLAFGFRKPLILHRALAELVDHRGISIAYDVPDLLATLDGLAREPHRLAEAVRGYADRTDLDFEGQAARFRRLIGLD